MSKSMAAWLDLHEPKLADLIAKGDDDVALNELVNRRMGKRDDDGANWEAMYENQPVVYPVARRLTRVERHSLRLRRANRRSSR